MKNYFKDQNRFFMFVLIGVLGPIYLLWWTATTQEAFRKTEGRGKSGSSVVLLSIFTFGVYAVVWQFKTCKAVKRFGGAELRGLFVFSYLFFFLGVIAVPQLIQREINVFAASEVLHRRDFLGR